MRLLQSLTLLALVSAVAVAAVWAGGRNWLARTVPLRRDYLSTGRVPPERLYDYGTRSTGLFASHGRFGWVRREDATVAVEPDEDVGAASPPAPHWAWRHSPADPGVADELVDDGLLDDGDADVRWRVPHLASCVGYTDDGMRHSVTVTAFLLDARGLLPLLGALALPGLAAWVRQRRRVARGLCRRCGYDLRATPGRCPECGTVRRAVSAPHST
jgi:hypothetical protein